jgi:F420-0:gamma-glutamyl ligase
MPTGPVLLCSTSSRRQQIMARVSTHLKSKGHRVQIEEHEQQDLFGTTRSTAINLVDELAGAAALVMGETGENRPVVVIRGIPYTRDEAASIRKLLV